MSSTVMIVSGIATVVVLLLAYAFIFQTIENKRKQQQRILSALKTRATNFKYMLSGFPENFLGQDLTVLVNRCMVDVYDQISKLDPQGDYAGEIQHYTNQLAEAQRNPTTAQRVQFSNPAQIKDVRAHLQELHQFIEKLLRRNAINGNQAKTYSKQVQKLILQVSVDSYLLHAKQAQASKKLRLAAHYYGLAKKLLVRENGKQVYAKQIQQLESLIQQLENLIKQEAATTPEAVAEPVKSKEWAEYEKEEEGWKKKTVYD